MTKELLNIVTSPRQADCVAAAVFVFFTPVIFMSIIVNNRHPRKGSQSLSDPPGRKSILTPTVPDKYNLVQINCGNSLKLKGKKVIWSEKREMGVEGKSEGERGGY